MLTTGENWCYNETPPRNGGYILRNVNEIKKLKKCLTEAMRCDKITSVAAEKNKTAQAKPECWKCRKAKEP